MQTVATQYTVYGTSTVVVFFSVYTQGMEPFHCIRVDQRTFQKLSCAQVCCTSKIHNTSNLKRVC